MDHDLRDVPVTHATPAALDGYETALLQYQSYCGDPVATLDATLAESPQFVIGHLFKALALITRCERRQLPAAEVALGAATRLAVRANPRERMLMAATRSFLDGEWHAGCRQLEHVLMEFPRDVMTLQTAQLIDLFRGDTLNVRNRVSRVLPHWDEAVPGFSYVLGMHAFGLEEMNQYAEAEATARRALALQPNDAWSVHAVAHVMEMQGRIDEGIEWLESRRCYWAGADNTIAVHNWWHLALFVLDGADYRRALALYDAAIHPRPAELVVSLLDATALLWRLHLEDRDVAGRFERLADEWQGLQHEQGYFAFNDFHAMLAFAATGREAAMRQLLNNVANAALLPGSNAAVMRDIGLPLVRGIAAFGRGRYAEAADLLAPARDSASRFGGSHAQRDILTLTLIEASLRSGQPQRARHYLGERLVHKPTQWARRLERRISRRQDAVLAA